MGNPLVRIHVPRWFPEWPWFNALVGSGYRFPYSVWDAFDLAYQCRRVKWTVQRARRGWSDRDLWNFGDHAVAVLRDGLAEFLKKGVNGVPGRLCVDAEGNETRPVNDAVTKWREILREMQEGFAAGEHVRWDCDCDFSTREAREAHDMLWRPKWDRAFDLAKEWLLAVWD